MRKKVLHIIYKSTLFILLTAITQIGGIVYLISLLVNKKWKKHFKYKLPLVFTILYLSSTFILTPLIAPLFGREKIKNTATISPTNYMTVLLNRNYVKPKLNELLLQTARDLKGSNIKIKYLDANFPFINKFPLLPHISHNDGKKIDISLIYKTPKGEITDKQKSMSGYGVFEEPKTNEYNQIKKCLSNGYFQYDFPKYLTFGKINSNLIFSQAGTKKLINGILKNKNLGKIFIEPHLKHRMKLNNKLIRYHGCGACRHDDHIHVQIK